MSELNRRLTTQDASFLYVEKPHLPMHGVTAAVYEGKLTLDEMIQAMEAKLPLLPRYRQKVVPAPYGLMHPTWEDDPDFDIRNHITEITLPEPADDRALAEVAAKYLLPPLDRSRPLWKTIVVHNLVDGNTGSISMAHHAMIDGVSGVDVTLVIHDLRPDAEPPPPPAPWQPAPMPDQLSLLEAAIRDNLIANAERWTEQTFGQFRPAEANSRAQAIANAIQSSMPQMLQPAPRTRFNGTVGSGRAFSWADFSFSEIRTIRSVLGGTVNDVVLTIEAGAIGRYLRHHGDRTEGLELRAMCPVSMRAAEGHGTLGNQVSMMLAPLYVGITDPVERHNAERTAMERLKQQGQAAGFYALTAQGAQVPAWQQAWASQIDAPNTMYNTVTSNMPGPQVPLYLRGHKLLRMFGAAMLSPNFGLFHAILSYNQVLTISATVDPAQIPDHWFYADCLTESFAELREAAERAAAAAGTPGPAAASASRTRKPRRVAAPA